MSDEGGVQLAAVAQGLARRYGCEHPSHVRVVTTTWRAAEELAYGSAQGAPEADDRPVYLIEMEGSFQAPTAPHGARPPVGSHASAIVDTQSGQIFLSGLGSRPLALDRLGVVFTPQ